MTLYCPNCINVLKKDHKKLGYRSAWYKCPKCGYRTRENSENYAEEKKLEEFEKEKERINNKWKEEDE
jgi:DNA-directed RNA polymerase subunit M/transcription elongation factor TFIIS